MAFGGWLFKMPNMLKCILITLQISCNYFVLMQVKESGGINPSCHNVLIYDLIPPPKTLNDRPGLGWQKENQIESQWPNSVWTSFFVGVSLQYKLEKNWPYALFLFHCALLCRQIGKKFVKMHYNCSQKHCEVNKVKG